MTCLRLRQRYEFQGEDDTDLPKLFKAFRLKGASLGGLVEHLELEIEQSEKKSSGGGQRQQLKNKSRRIFKKVMEKIKKAFGLKKNKGQQSRLESA